jgi:hypothetical protein
MWAIETTGRGVLPRLLAAATFVGGIVWAGLAAAETLPWPATKPPHRLWQTPLDSGQFSQVLFDVGADGAVLVAAIPSAERGKSQVNFIWLDRDGAVRRRASLSEASIGGTGEDSIGGISQIALMPDGGVLLAVLRGARYAPGVFHAVRLDASTKVVYNRRTATQVPKTPGGALFPNFARAPLVAADGSALFAMTIGNPAPAHGLYLERVNAAGHPLWRARLDAGLQEGRSRQLLDLRLLENGETVMLYFQEHTQARERTALELRRFGKRGGPGSTFAFGAPPDNRWIGCGAFLDSRTIVTFEGPGGSLETDPKLFRLAWHDVDKGKLREQRIELDEPRHATCTMFAVDAGGIVLKEGGLGVVRLSGEGKPLWSFRHEGEVHAMRGLTTTLDLAKDGDAQRIVVTRYADRPAE